MIWVLGYGSLETAWSPGLVAARQISVAKDLPTDQGFEEILYRKSLVRITSIKGFAVVSGSGTSAQQGGSQRFGPAVYVGVFPPFSVKRSPFALPHTPQGRGGAAADPTLTPGFPSPHHPIKGPRDLGKSNPDPDLSSAGGGGALRWVNKPYPIPFVCGITLISASIFRTILDSFSPNAGRHLPYVAYCGSPKPSSAACAGRGGVYA